MAYWTWIGDQGIVKTGRLRVHLSSRCGLQRTTSPNFQVLAPPSSKGQLSLNCQRGQQNNLCALFKWKRSLPSVHQQHLQLCQAEAFELAVGIADLHCFIWPYHLQTNGPIPKLHMTTACQWSTHHLGLALANINLKAAAANLSGLLTSDSSKLTVLFVCCPIFIVRCLCEVCEYHNHDQSWSSFR